MLQSFNMLVASCAGCQVWNLDCRVLFCRVKEYHHHYPSSSSSSSLVSSSSSPSPGRGVGVWGARRETVLDVEGDGTRREWGMAGAAGGRVKEG